jgi:hypothetical protein
MAGQAQDAKTVAVRAFARWRMLQVDETESRGW